MHFSTHFILRIERGVSIYNKFKKTRFTDKSQKLFDKIPKAPKSKKSSANLPKIDVKKETIAALRTIDYARLREYNITHLLKSELTSYPLFLTEDGLLKKPNPKSELFQEIEKKT